jgi:ABC-type transport system substrate-binding protein
VTASPSIGSTLFYMNMARPPFNDLAVRKAMELAIDPEQINRMVFGGALETPRSFFPANNVFSDQSLTFPTPSQTEAQRLINDYVTRTGSDVSFAFNTTGTAAQVAMAQVVQTMLQKLAHVRVELHTLTTNQFVAELVQKSFDVAAFTYVGVDPEPEFSETVLSTGSRNFQSYSSATVDHAVADSRTSTDPAARAQALETVQQQLLADMPFFVLNRNTAFWAARAAVRDLVTFDDGGLLADRVWIKTR